MTLFKGKNPAITAIMISYISIFIMGAFGIIRIFYPSIPFVFSISDMLWVYSGCLLLHLIPLKGWKKLLIVSIPYIGVMVDEIMQGVFPYYPHPHTQIASLFWSGTFDPLDLFAYTLGFVLAIVTWKLLMRKEIEK